MKKIYEATGKVIASDDKALILEHFISTDTPDRDGDIVVPGGVKITGIPVVLQQHGFDSVAGTEPIAKVLEIRIGAHKGGASGLIARTQYYDGSALVPPDNTGRRLYEKARDGFMPNFSIGFNVIKSEPLTSGGRRIVEAELFEYSQVAIPANPEATSIVKSLSFTFDKEKSMPSSLKSIADRVATAIPVDAMSQMFNAFLYEVSACGDDKKLVKKLVGELAELVEPHAIAFAKACAPQPESLVKTAIAKAFGIIYKADNEPSMDGAPEGATVPAGATVAAEATAETPAEGPLPEPAAVPVAAPAATEPAAPVVTEPAASVAEPVPPTSTTPTTETTNDTGKSMILRIRQDVSPTALTKKDIEAYVRDALRSGFGDAMQSELRRAMGRID